MQNRSRAALAAALVGALATLSACGGGSGSGSDDSTALRLSGFSILETANEGIFEDFQATDEGADVEFEPSYGASGDQSRAVADGSKADVVHYSLETDITRLVDAGIVADDWKDNATNGIATSSVVVFVVRSGNPDNITSWDDLVKPGVEVITPNPGSSGSARWNILAAWAHATGGTDDEAAGRDFITKMLNNVIALPSSGREATTAFTDGSGDVLLSYENEAILAKQNGADIDYVVPDDTLLIENPAAVTVDAPQAASDFLSFLTGPEAQADYASFGFRPVVDGVDIPEVEGANDPSDPFPTPGTLYTIDDNFGGWADAAPKYFGTGEEGDVLGIITELQQKTGQEGEE
ncbi:sulfate transport system substrate-binding protein [Nocardioides exalbidus]|uniref:Sulfate transport system substrate-binding protein n=1 Tax=Nocardioides exalbidus TaxID=402596 RepID=A0A1H4RSB2_9ACTN|nr:sulfate ABC transporter substrate-binding protein [Nocardioides exalbidus]SEC34746.1 sulfate transport system substrate-binding protein [Nocardioides exalbidus]